MKRQDIGPFMTLSLPALIAIADRVRSEHAASGLDLCCIMNAKSGACKQDCKFCAQSARHRTGIRAYPLRSKKEIFKQAQAAVRAGAERFGIVTSGDRLSGKEFKAVIEAVSEIAGKLGIRACASLGSMDKKRFSALKKAGLSRYHHNIEASPRYFQKIVSTHTFQDRIDTIKAAKDAGLEVCSGGIIGMGEELSDRIEMAFILKELGVDCVPVNILVAIKGTALEAQEPLSCREAIRTIALFRVILEDKTIKVAAGRESVLKDFQAMAFMAGANGMLIGGYLTTKGRSPEEDRLLVKEIKKLWQR